LEPFHHPHARHPRGSDAGHRACSSAMPGSSVSAASTSLAATPAGRAGARQSVRGVMKWLQGRGARRSRGTRLCSCAPPPSPPPRTSPSPPAPRRAAPVGHCARLRFLVLYCAALCCAVLCCAMLCCAALCCAMRRPWPSGGAHPVRRARVLTGGPQLDECLAVLRGEEAVDLEHRRIGMHQPEALVLRVHLRRPATRLAFFKDLVAHKRPAALPACLCETVLNRTNSLCQAPVSLLEGLIRHAPLYGATFPPSLHCRWRLQLAF
jgi:hypothetical protein